MTEMRAKRNRFANILLQLTAAALIIVVGVLVVFVLPLWLTSESMGISPWQLLPGMLMCPG